MRTLRSSILGGVIAALLLAQSATAAPAEQSVNVEVTPGQLIVHPLGTARVQVILTNATADEQSFHLEILLIRADGSLATAYLSDPVALASGTTVSSTHAIRRADGAVRAVITPRSWPDLAP